MRTIWSSILFYGVGVFGVAFVAGGCSAMANDCSLMLRCEGDPGDSGSGGQGGSAASASTGTMPEACSGTVSEVASVNEETPGVFVRLEGSDNDDGTMNKPVRTLGHAVSLADSSKRTRVYACAQEFKEVVSVPAGVEVYGGFDCNDGWKVGTLRTTLTEGSGAVPLRLLSAVEAGQRTKIERLDVMAKVAMKPGQSSIAAVVGDVEAEFVHCTLQAADGADSVTGESINIGLSNANNGGSGTAKCDPNPSGGTGAHGECGSVDVSGGAGGKGQVKGLNNMADPEVGSAGNPPGMEGAGGKASSDKNYNNSCVAEKKMRGKDGGNGTPGAGGGKESEGPAGSLSIEKGYEGEDGQPGTDGQPGGGGGGGGGRLAPEQPNCFTGASGAGGGAGGCGGKGGGGGQAGGSSIALVSLAEGKKLMLTATILTASNGGRGGDGSEGQNGALGGQPGDSNAVNGCPGGSGGNGGKGGVGGGGSGGHSIGIAHKFQNLIIECGTIQIAVSGSGGKGIDSESNGVDGITQHIAHLPK